MNQVILKIGLIDSAVFNYQYYYYSTITQAVFPLALASGKNINDIAENIENYGNKILLLNPKLIMSECVRLYTSISGDITCS